LTRSGISDIRIGHHILVFPVVLDDISEHAMHMLFTAKWCIPQATVALGLQNTDHNWELVKNRFREYCVEKPVERKYRFGQDDT
jgi:hypothetical protein